MILQKKFGLKLGLGIRASAHLPKNVFAEPLQKIVESLPEDLGKLAINSWVGALQCKEVKWKVFTSTDRNLDIPFRGPRMYKEAVGGWDILCQQRVCVLSSFRMIWQTVLDRELCLMAALRDVGFTIKQMRVDGVICHVSRKQGQKRLLELKEETWPSGKNKYKVKKLDKDAPELITVGSFHPVCQEGKAPSQIGDWLDLSLSEASEHMLTNSIALVGQGGTGKTWFAREAAKHHTGKVICTAKTHVACQNLQIPAETITLARLYRKYILLGAVESGTLIIVDEIGLATTHDFQQILLPLKKLGCIL